VTCQSYTVNTKSELDRLLNDDAFQNAEKMRLVEVMMDQFDAPWALQASAAITAKVNKYAPTQS
jgi:pyruvate decarboxylase